MELASDGGIDFLPGADCIDLYNELFLLAFTGFIVWGDEICSRATFSAKALNIPPFFGNVNWRPICKQEQTTTSESMDALPLSDIFEFLMENAPVAAAVGGVAASTALVANPSLPITCTNGVPPGIYTYY